ncbi:MAG: discoidin domain-containing protein [Desulfobacterales bacterium]
MFALIKPLSKWQKRWSGVMIVAAVLALAAPEAVAIDSLKLLHVFQKNDMPGSQEIQKSYTNFTYKPYDRQELSFTILIPNNAWRDIEISIDPETLQNDDQQLIPLACQKAPGSEKGEAKIEVFYIRLSMEIDLHDYVNIILQNNTDMAGVLMRRKGRYSGRAIEEILLASEQDSKKYLARLTFSRHGDRIFMVSGSSLESEFKRYAENFTAASVSFSAVRNSPNAYAENMVDLNSTGTPRLRFHYPKTWTVKELGKLNAGRNGVDLNLTVKNKEGQSVLTYGYIHVSAFLGDQNKTPDQVLTALKKDFEQMPVSLDRCILRADIFPDLPKPLGKVERWNAIAGGNLGEVGFLVLPKGNDTIAMGLFSMRPEDNLVTWSHTWRVFEIIVNDLSAQPIDLSSLKHCTLPSEDRLKALPANTMNDFARAVGQGNFDDFYDHMSTTFKLQSTPAELHRAFQGFAQIEEITQLKAHAPILEEGDYVNKDGVLKILGHYPTQPQATTFRLIYLQEQNKWKLSGIRVAMEKRSQIDKQQSQKTNLLFAENGGQVVFCSSQYNQTSWGADNLIDGELGTNHGYASRNTEPAEIVFSLPKIETIAQFCFNPYTTESSTTWAKLVRVDVSTQSPEKGFEPVGEFTLHNRRSEQNQSLLAEQCFDISPVQARYIRLHLLSNHGGGYIEMGEFKAYAASK